jgi:LPXTG-motif cell wall-anchored protein
MSWGIINEFTNLSLNYTETTSIQLSGNTITTNTPSIKVDPSALVIAPMTILYANVTVNTTGVAPGTNWDVSLLGSTQLLGNATTGAIIRLSTLKKVQVHVIAPLAVLTTSVSSSAATAKTGSASNYTLPVVAIVILIIIITAWLLLSKGKKR